MRYGFHINLDVCLCRVGLIYILKRLKLESANQLFSFFVVSPLSVCSYPDK